MNKKIQSALKFLGIFILSFIIMECVEYLISILFKINISELKYGWMGLMIVYGFKYHIICCILPAIWAGYNCKHTKCKHMHCG